MFTNLNKHFIIDQSQHEFGISYKNEFCLKLLQHRKSWKIQTSKNSLFLTNPQPNNLQSKNPPNPSDG